MAFDINYVTTQVKNLLPLDLDATDIYDTKLNILVSNAIQKMKIGGADIEAVDKDGNAFFTEGSLMGFQFCTCCSYQVLKDMDLDVDMDYLTTQYITSLGEMRCYITAKQS